MGVSTLSLRWVWVLVCAPIPSPSAGFDEPEAAAELGGIQPLWRDVVASSQTPLHVMVGGGDQLYNDGVWEAPALKEVRA